MKRAVTLVIRTVEYRRLVLRPIAEMIHGPV